MELRSLEYFLACVDKGSLTGAAESLYTTQPHVSQVIKSLEWELGVKLFRRTGSGIELTDEGEKIRLYAENTLKNARLIKETCAFANNETLRVAVNSSSRLAYSMEEFISSKENADLALQYTECSIEEMMNLINLRHYDIGLLFVPENKLTAFSYMTEHRHLRFTTILRSDLILSCGKKSRFHELPQIEPEELDGVSLIQPEDDFFSVDELLLEHEGFKSGKIRVDRRIRTNSIHLILRVLKNTDTCNVGTYWVKDKAGKESLYGPIINGFQGKVYFGYMQADNRELGEKAKEFLKRLSDSK
ncbi:MAG: LysR family transcriptional regulator [Lachnospiraceae bacterium]|nr:LysR family transcriptional regulator [Lachnospiraceae bacterium]